MTWRGDLAVWLCLLGLLLLGSECLRPCAPGLPPAVRRLMALPCWAVASFVAHWWQLPASPWSGPLEQLGPAWPLGWVGYAAGLAGLLAAALQAVRLRQRAADGTPLPLGARLLAWLPLLAWPLTLLPPWALDETAYHLALPLRARWHGSLAPPLGHANGAFFALLDWFGSWALHMGSVSAARGVQLLLLGCAIEASMACVGRARAWRVGAAGLLLCASPVALWQLGTGYVDVASAALVGAAAMCWPGRHNEQMRQPAPEDLRGPADEAQSGTRWRRQALASAWLLGAAVASKATLLPLLAALAGSLWAGRGHWTKASCGWALALAALPCLPFVAFGLTTYGSPLYPFVPPLWPGHEGLLPTQLAVWPQFMAQHGPHGPDGVAITGPLAWLLLPHALLLGAAFASPRFDGVVGGIVPLALAVGLWRLWRRRGAGPAATGAATWPSTHEPPRHLLWWAAALGGGWLATSWQARFLLPVLFLLALWTTLGWSCAAGRPGSTRAQLRARRLWPWLPAALLQAAFWPALQGHMPPLPGAVWQAPSERTALRSQWNPASRTCEQHVAPGDRVLLAWTQRLLLWCPQASVADSYDEAAHLAEWLLLGAPEAAVERFAARGVAYLLVDERYWLADTAPLPAAERAQQQRLARAWQQTLATGRLPCRAGCTPRSGGALYAIGGAASAQDQSERPP